MSEMPKPTADAFRPAFDPETAPSRLTVRLERNRPLSLDLGHVRPIRPPVEALWGYRILGGGAIALVNVGGVEMALIDCRGTVQPSRYPVDIRTAPFVLASRTADPEHGRGCIGITDRKPLIIGRDHLTERFGQDYTPQVSREHLRIVYDQERNQIQLTDSFSTNGTEVTYAPTQL